MCERAGHFTPSAPYFATAAIGATPTAFIRALPTLFEELNLSGELASFVTPALVYLRQRAIKLNLKTVKFALVIEEKPVAQ